MLKRLLVLCVGLFLVGGISHAGIVVFNLSLNGANESPPQATPATGSAIITLDTTAHTLGLNIAFAGLLGTSTASHIHCCTLVPFTGNAGVATTTPTFLNFPLNVNSGTYVNTLDLTLASSYNPAFVSMFSSLAAADAALEAGIIAGESYLNIHSTFAPGGEIRAFLTPEPTTMLLMGAGLGMLLLARRRLA